MKKSTTLSRIGLHSVLILLVIWSVLPFLWTIQTSIKFTRDVAAKDPVFWGYESVLEADMICIRELLKTNTPWRMYMNPAGSELPLKPFKEMRQMIMANGEKNVIDFEPFNKTDRQLKVFRTYR